MEEFMKRKNLNVYYTEADSSDIIIGEFGYNNFDFIKPVTVPRVQDMYTLHFIFEGSGVLNIYGKQYAVKQNDMFFVPPNEPMSYYPNSDNLWKYAWITFSGKNATFYANAMGFDRNKPIKHSENHHEVHKILCDIFAKLNNNENVSYYSALSAFYSIIDTETKKKTFNEDCLSRQIDLYLTCHFRNPELRVENICRDLNISHSYLCKIYKKDMGTTVKNRLLNLRIDEAKKLLSDTDLSIASVAYSVGFSDNIHFMKIFKEHTGMTAGEFRK